MLLDLVRYFDEGPWVLGGRNVTGADLQGACDAQGVEIQSGDIVLLRFGYLDMWWAQNGEVGFDQPGLGLDGAEWLAAKDVIAVGADNSAVECVPFDGNDFLAVHKVLLVRHGIYLLEFLDLSAPARRRMLGRALVGRTLEDHWCDGVSDQPDLRRLVARSFPVWLSPLGAGW